jgi:hypothetical protein
MPTTRRASARSHRTGFKLRGALLGISALVSVGLLGCTEQRDAELTPSHASPDAGAEHPDRYFPVSEYVPMVQLDTVPSVSGADDHLQELVTLGTLDDNDNTVAFGHIAGLAISQDSTLAVGDAIGCAVHLFQLPGGEFLESLGQCGEGPGEFLQIGDVFFSADTLGVIDIGLRSIIHLDRTGDELGRERFPIRTHGFDGIPARIDVLGPWTLVMPLRQEPELVDDVSMSNAGAEVARTHFLPEIEAYSRHAGALTPRRACLVQTREGEPKVATANRWAHELLITNVELIPELVFRGTLEWKEPDPEDDLWGPGALPPAILCGQDFVIQQNRQIRVAPGSNQAVVRNVVTEAVGMDGTVIFRSHAESAEFPALGVLTPAVGRGELAVFFQNGYGPYPTVHVFRLVQPSRNR